MIRLVQMLSFGVNSSPPAKQALKHTSMRASKIETSGMMGFPENLFTIRPPSNPLSFHIAHPETPKLRLENHWSNTMPTKRLTFDKPLPL